MHRLLLTTLLLSIAAPAWAAGGPDGWAVFDPHWWQAQHGWCAAWQAQQPALFLVGYVLLFALLSAFTLPGCAPLALLAGTWFGALGGTLLIGLASTLGAVISFLIARHVTPARWRQRLQGRWGAPLQRFDGLMRQNAGIWLLTLRLLPVVPFPALNPLLGLSAMPLRQFFWPSLVGLTLGSLPYVWAGLSLMDAWHTGQAAWGAAAAASLMLVTAAVAWRFRR